MAAFTASLDEENTAVDDEMNATLATTPPGKVGDLFARVTRESADRLDERLAELEVLEPPAEAADAHDALLATSRTLAEESRGYAALLSGVHADAGSEADLCVGLFAPPSGG